MPPETAPKRTLKCEYCLGEIPYGAKICIKCNARIKYGPPFGISIVAVIPAVLLFTFFAWTDFLPPNHWMKVGLFVVLWFGFENVLKHLTRHRVAFSRPFLR